MKRILIIVAVLISVCILIYVIYVRFGKKTVNDTEIIDNNNDTGIIDNNTDLNENIVIENVNIETPSPLGTDPWLKIRDILINSTSITAPLIARLKELYDTIPLTQTDEIEAERKGANPYEYKMLRIMYGLVRNANPQEQILYGTSVLISQKDYDTVYNKVVTKKIKKI